MSIIGRQIEVKRGKLQEVITIQNVSKIVNKVYSISGKNEKKSITVTMTIDEISEKLI